MTTDTTQLAAVSNNYDLCPSFQTCGAPACPLYGGRFSQREPLCYFALSWGKAGERERVEALAPAVAAVMPGFITYLKQFPSAVKRLEQAASTGARGANLRKEGQQVHHAGGCEASSPLFTTPSSSAWDKHKETWRNRPPSAHAQCGGCGRLFGGQRGAEFHRVGGQCQDPASTNMVQNADGVWIQPAPRA